MAPELFLRLSDCLDSTVVVLDIPSLMKSLEIASKGTFGQGWHFLLQQ